MKLRLCMMAAVLFYRSIAFGQSPFVSAHAFSTTSNPPPNAANASMKPAVLVNGAILTEADVLREMYTIFPYANQHNGFPKALEADIRNGAIEMLVFEELLYQEAKRLKVTISPEQLSKAESEFRKQLGASACEQFLRTECQGSKQVLFEKIRRSLLIEKMLKTEVEQKSVVSVIDAKAYYARNPKQFEKPERFRIQSISILPPQNSGVDVDNETRKRADEAYKLATTTNSYQDFGLLAEKMSDDDWHVNMGDRKLIDASKLPPLVVKAAEAMKPGEVSKLIQLGNAYTIFRLVEHTPAGKTPFAEARATLQSDLQKQQLAERRASLNQRLRKNAKIEVL
jgi:parvulin-like peptidyl-prolyl isomerase